MEQKTKKYGLLLGALAIIILSFLSFGAPKTATLYYDGMGLWVGEKKSDDDEVYEGEISGWSSQILHRLFNDWIPNGQGTYTAADGSKYVGDFKDGRRNGQGILTFPDGRKYVGEYKDDQKNGQGTYTWPDGQKYVGEYKDDQKNGQGTYTAADGTVKSGLWKDGEFLGTK